jgi:hypothetical protein
MTGDFYESFGNGLRSLLRHIATDALDDSLSALAEEFLGIGWSLQLGEFAAFRGVLGKHIAQLSQ